MNCVKQGDNLDQTKFPGRKLHKVDGISRKTIPPVGTQQYCFQAEKGMGGRDSLWGGDLKDDIVVYLTGEACLVVHFSAAE